jgi:hypothetical protein
VAVRREGMEELLQLLSVRPGPETDGKTFVDIKYKVGFEPDGRASETWDGYWEVALVQIPHHWRSTKGWVRGTTDHPITFGGATIGSAINNASTFLREARAQGLVLP